MMPYCIFNFLLLSFLLPLTLISCSGVSTIYPEQDSAPTELVNVDNIPDAVPQPSNRSKYGNPSSYVVFGKRYHVMESGEGYKERGIASWYGKKFHGRRTSSGEPYDMHGMTAAHKSLPLPTYVRVTNLKNKRQVILKVNDRGPFHENRIIDLSHTAAVKLDIKHTGTGWVEVEAIHSYSNPQTIPDSAPVTEAVAKSNMNNISQSALPPTLQGRANLYLQIGAFTNSNNAKNLTQNLTQKLNSANIVNKVNISNLTINELPIFRVRIGPIENIIDAEKISASVVEFGFEQPKIIIE